MFRPERDTFGATFTSLNDSFSKSGNVEQLFLKTGLRPSRAFHDRGIFTWVSLEPTLDA
jgi:hypothetical protein